MIVKTVVVINDFNYVQGGASKMAIETAKILKESGLKVIFFSAVNRLNDNISGIEYVSTNQKEALKEKNKLKGIVNGVYNIKARKKLKQLLKTLDRETTIIHIHGWTKALSSSIFDVAFKMKFKTVLTLHDYFLPCPNGGLFNYKTSSICNIEPMSIQCKKCDCDSRSFIFKQYRVLRQFVQNKIVKLPLKLEHAITISDFSNDILKKYLSSKTNIYRINNVVINSSTSERIKAENNDVFLFIGRVDKEKGIESFCEAVNKASVKAIVVGEGKLREKLQQMYNSIEFVGWKDEKEIKKYLNIARILIFPSLWYETMGLTTLEALSKGVPVLCAKSNASTEYVKNDKNGFIFNTNDIDDLVNAINKCSDEKIKKFSEYAYNNYEQKIFSPEYYLNSLLNLYGKIN